MTSASGNDGTIEWSGVTYRTVLASADSGGAMAIVESVAQPDSGPPRHVHDGEDETFVILSGRCRIWIEGEERVAGPGQSVFIARGREHTFKVVGDGPARYLFILTPGGFETFFAAMAAGGFRIPDDMAAIQAAAARHRLRFTGPPLA